MPHCPVNGKAIPQKFKARLLKSGGEETLRMLGIGSCPNTKIPRHLVCELTIP